MAGLVLDMHSAAIDHPRYRFGVHIISGFFGWIAARSSQKNRRPGKFKFAPLPASER